MLIPPPPIRTDASNDFAHNTMRTRIPSIVREVGSLNPDYAQSIQDALERLAGEIESNAVMEMFAPPAPDYATWAAAHAKHHGESWQNSTWFHAEPFAYRLVIEAVRWFETLRDPFAPKKAEEFASAALWHTLDEALSTRGLNPEERLSALIEFDLWGNRIDLSYALAAAHGAKAGTDDLLIDDTARAVEHLLRTVGVVHLICDNCGTELATDLALADGLLEMGRSVWLHVKAHPYFVSDTIVADVHELWRLLLAREGETRALGERLIAAFEMGQLRVLPDFFWCTDRFLTQMPDYLSQTFTPASLVILKGDLNYRRAMSDALWEPTTPFADIVSYFSAPLLALRTLKSDLVVGLAPGVAESLAAIDPQWRINGKYGLIQGKGLT